MKTKRFVSLLLAFVLAFTAVPILTASAAPLTAVSVNSPNVDYVLVGNNVTFTATVTPANPDNLVWGVYEEDGFTPTTKASITQGGVLTASASGYVAVTASDDSGVIRSSYPIFILDPAKQYNILSKNGGNALTAGTNSVTLSALSNSAAQKWQIIPVGDYVRFVNDGRAITVPASGSTVSLSTDSASNNNMQFTLNGRISYTDAANWINRGMSTELGSFKLASRGRSGQTLNNNSNTLNIAATATENAWNETTLAQKFRIVDSDEPAPSLLGMRKITGATFGSPDPPYNNNQANAYTVVFDGDTSTYYDNSVGVGYAGMSFSTPQIVKAIRLFPRSQAGLRAFKGFIQASNDGISYKNLLEFNYSPINGVYTIFNINNDTAYTYYRYITQAWGFGNIAELEFYEALDPNALDIGLDVPAALAVGDTATIVPTFANPLGEPRTPDSYTLTSLNPEVATITSTGIITGVAVGVATIKCSAVLGGQTWEVSAQISIFEADQPVITARSFSDLPAKTAIYSTIGDANSAFEGNAVGTLGNGKEMVYMVNNLNVNVANLRNDNAVFDLVFDGAVFLYGEAQLNNVNQRDHTSWKNNFAAGYAPTSAISNHEYQTLTFTESSRELFSITVNGSRLRVEVTQTGIGQSNLPAGLTIPISAYIPEYGTVTLKAESVGTPLKPIVTLPKYSDQEMETGDPIPVNVLIIPTDYEDWPLPVPVRKTPMMGWSSWNCFGLNIDEAKIKGQIDAFVNTPLYEAGYRYVNIDDGYQKGRDELSGLINYDTSKFPKGMKEIADYAHKKGLLAGMYSDAGDNTCGSGASSATKGNYGYNVGFYNSYENMPNDRRDALTFMHDWGYDFVKVDWCGGGHSNPGQEQARYSSIGENVWKVGSDDGSYKIFNICRWAFPGVWAPDVADSWRTSGDINASWSSILSCLDTVKSLKQYAGPGHVNDPDMLEVGNGSLTYDQNKSHFSMWCMVSAPLALGNDLRSISEETLSILTNKELIAIDQDPAVDQAEVIREYRTGTTLQGEVWVKNLGKINSNVKAVALLNRSTTTTLTMSVNFAADLGLSGIVAVRDLWSHQEIPVESSYSVSVPPCGVVVLKVTADPQGVVSGDIYDTKLSDIADSFGNPIALSGVDWKQFGFSAFKAGSYLINNDPVSATAPMGVGFTWIDSAAPVAEGASNLAASLSSPGDSFEFTVPYGLGPGTKLDSRWGRYNVQNAGPTGQYELTTVGAGGDIWQGNGSAVNLFYIDPPTGDNWEAVVQITSSFTGNYPSVGLIAWVDNDNYVGFWRRYHTGLVSSGRIFDMVSEVGSAGDESGAQADSALGLSQAQANSAYIKLVKNGNSFTGYVSADGINWTTAPGFTKTNAAVAGNANLKIGLFSNCSGYTVRYNNFKLNDTLIPFAITENLAVKTYLGAKDARVKVEAISGDKSNAYFIDSASGEKDVVFDTRLLQTQTMPLKVKVTLEETYAVGGSALIGAATVVEQEEPAQVADFIRIQNASTSGAPSDLSDLGSYDWVKFGSSGARKDGGGFLGNYATSINAARSFNESGIAVNASGSFIEVVLPPSDSLKKADIFFNVYKAEVAVNVYMGSGAPYSYSMFDTSDTGIDTALTIWYAGSSPIRVLLTTTVSFVADARVRLDAVTASNLDGLFDTGMNLSNGVYTAGLNLSKSTGTESVKLFKAYYDAGGKMVKLEEETIELTSKAVSSRNVTFTAPTGYPGGSAKFFLWDSNYIPITFNLPYEPPTETYYPEPFVQSYIGTLTAKSAVLSGAKLVDVRSAAEYATGHIKWETGEAVNAPVTDMLNGIAAISGTTKDTAFILYCNDAYRSLLAKRILDYAGYTNVSVLGSMDNWNLSVRLLMTSSIPNRYANNPITIRYENVSVYDDGTYQLYYSLGPNSTVSEAVVYPTGGVTLTGPNTVKAYLKYNDQVVAEAQTDYDPYIAAPIPSVPSNVIYASDLPASEWLVTISGWGTTRRNLSIDSAALRVNNVTYTKGIGTHATGYIDIAIPEGSTRFITVAGIDTEVTLTRGNVVQFFVYVDGVLIDKSLEITPNQYKVFDIDLSGYAGAGHVLRIACDQGSDGMDYDHADWAIAAFVMS